MLNKFSDFKIFINLLTVNSLRCNVTRKYFSFFFGLLFFIFFFIKLTESTIVLPVTKILFESIFSFNKFFLFLIVGQKL